MSEIKYTPEPWDLKDNETFPLIQNANEYVVYMSIPNFHRAAICVNACRNIPNEEVIEWVGDNWNTLKKYHASARLAQMGVVTIKVENDELKKKVDSYFNEFNSSEFKDGLKKAIQSAIDIDYPVNEEGEEYSVETFDLQEAMEEVISFLKKYFNPPTP